MSYLNTIEYTIRPEESFSVIHNCAGCGRKEHFINTKRFRVNANGNRLDVWLIYQCEKCKHTLNLPIYERVDRRKIPVDDYALFLKNDELLAVQYGMDSAFFKKNRMEVDWESVTFTIQENKVQESTLPERNFSAEDVIIVHNPHGVRIRDEMIVGNILNLSRSMVKRLIERQQILIHQEGLDLKIVIQ